MAIFTPAAMNTESLWADAIFPRQQYPPLAEDLDAEVVVVGAGITGVSTAHLIAQAGFKVVLLERDLIGCGDTACTTAHLTYMTDTRLSDLVKTCGGEKAQVAWSAGRRAMAEIKSTAELLGEAVELKEVPGYLAAAEDSANMTSEKSQLKHEYELASEATPKIRPLCG